jgi:hypothetical protein
MLVAFGRASQRQRTNALTQAAVSSCGWPSLARDSGAAVGPGGSGGAAVFVHEAAEDVDPLDRTAEVDRRATDPAGAENLIHAAQAACSYS